MEPASEQVAKIFNANEPLTPDQEKISAALNSAMHIIYEHGLAKCYTEDNCIGESLSDTWTGSLGVFNALSFFLADQMAMHVCQGCIGDHEAEQWQEKVREAFLATYQQRLEIRRTEISAILKGKAS